MHKYVGIYGESPSIIGIYDDASPIIQVMVKDGRLVAKVNGGFSASLSKLDETRFSSLSGTLVFIPNADGKIEFLYAGGHGLKKQKEK